LKARLKNLDQKISDNSNQLSNKSESKAKLEATLKELEGESSNWRDSKKLLDFY